MAPGTKTAAGNLIAQLYEARQAVGAIAFDTMARQQGQLRLQHYGVALSDGITDGILAVVTQVDATMRAFAH
jgi:hypothetical protein